MIQVEKKVKKISYCKNCFSVLEWESGDEQFSRSTGPNVLCPKCGATLSLNEMDEIRYQDAE